MVFDINIHSSRVWWSGVESPQTLIWDRPALSALSNGAGFKLRFPLVKKLDFLINKYSYSTFEDSPTTGDTRGKG